VLYLCLTRPCVVAELTRQAQRQSLEVEDLLPRELWEVAVRLDKVLDLTDAAGAQSSPGDGRGRAAPQWPSHARRVSGSDATAGLRAERGGRGFRVFAALPSGGLRVR
jgi:hypothetical protein